MDVDFTISGAAAGEAFAIDLNAEYAGGDKKLAAYTYTTEPVVAGSATHRITWDMGKDYPDFRAEDLRVSVTATPFSGTTPVYMVIDLAGGKDATTYPVRYTTKDPGHVQGAINEPCQTTELWLRRIPARNQVFVVGSTTVPADGNTSFYTKLTKDFYIGVFETTQQQWFQLAGTWPSCMSNTTYRASRPLDAYYPQLLFGSSYTWSDENQTLADTCFMQQLRTKTGLSTLNLPTEAQWQFAACAGTITTPAGVATSSYYYNGYSQNEIARYSGTQAKAYDNNLCDTNSGSACVGSYKPNNFGLYDMLGNVWEDCLDRAVPLSSLKEYYTNHGRSFPITDPNGLTATDATAITTRARILTRGGSYLNGSAYSQLFGDTSRSEGYLSYSGDGAQKTRGFRFCVTCE